jgi:hypothetical protein
MEKEREEGEEGGSGRGRRVMEKEREEGEV